MCQTLQVSRSGYYAWLKRSKSKRQIENERLLKQIKKVHYQSRYIYGSPRITAALKKRNIRCSKNRIARLMRTNNIRSIIKKKHRTTTNSRHRLPVAANIVNQQFRAERPNQIWFSDITYIRVQQYWVYLAAILDLFSRKIVSWSLSLELTPDFVLQSIRQAIIMRKPEPGLIFHSDRGVQYASYATRNILKEHAIISSMSRKGDCYDNAVMESFFGTLKSEFVSFQKFQNYEDTYQKLFDYIEIFYNHKRLHSSLGYHSPVDFEINYAKEQKRAF
jgi:transposase InsO family protein